MLSGVLLTELFPVVPPITAPTPPASTPPTMLRPIVPTNDF